ncbi:MAG: radical SAM family heme chaperone HemW [Alphaproteobacteria bacterium]|jgi:oxygen-independent coproporphyrinogen-3 oxidase|nr:radical SAM family heme chaperone HemW [Alphaproteobacteria bacterium]
MSIFNKDEISIYFHVPFCKNKCPYCDFNSYTNISEFNEDEIVYCYKKHIEYWRAAVGDRSVGSIFFGGGTPSILRTSSLENIINSVRDNFRLSDECEISIEVNPNSVDEEIFKKYVKIGINRLSIGVQSLSKKDLKFLGRSHSVEDAIDAIKTAKKYFKNMSADFIYSLPEQDAENWGKELNEIIKLDLPHYSLYQLTIEENTPFGRAKIKIPQDEKSLKLFSLTRNLMKENLIEAYEVSNFSKDGFECKHNKKYWDGSSYIGIGAGAHGRVFLGDKWLATENCKSPKKWIESIDRPVESYKTFELNENERVEEILITSLRTKYGFEYSKYKKQISLDSENLKRFRNNGLIEFNENRIRLTEEGIPMINYLLPKIIL